jgi:hypothetical protein
MVHLIPVLEGVLALLSFELFFFKPSLVVFFVLAPVIFIILGMLIPKKKFLGKGEFWRYLPDPLIFILSAVLLVLFFENKYLRHFFALGSAIYLFLYFENLFFYLASEQENKRENFLRMTNLMNVVTIFFLAAGLYGVKTFLQLPIIWLAAGFFFFTAWLFYGTMWIVRKTRLRENAAYILSLALICAEIFLAVSFLPLGFYTSGAISGIVYYCISGVLINFLDKGAAPWRRYLTIGGILLLLVLLTARWV